MGRLQCKTAAYFDHTPEPEVTQDPFNDGAVVDQADNSQRADATGTQQGVTQIGDRLHSSNPESSLSS